MTIDYAKARETMVEQQVRPWDVFDVRVLDALASLRYRNDLDRRYMSRLAEHAKAQGREDIATAIGKAVKRYDFRVTSVRWARRFGLRRGGR